MSKPTENFDHMIFMEDSNEEFLKLVSFMQQTTNSTNTNNNSTIKEEKQK